MKLLSRIFIKDFNNIKSQTVRSAYGKLASILGIVLNIILFSMKLFVGIITGSVSISADAFNNLSDAGSSILSLVSFIFSSKPADADHPFGHERLEYIFSMIISFIIMYFGLTLGIDSIKEILHPVAIEFDPIMVVVLLISIVVKLYMYLYNKKYGKMVNSTVMEAASIDSISDVLATSVVLIGILVSHVFSLQLDGFLGVFVAIFILKSGFDIMSDTFNKIIGVAPEPEFVKEVINKIMSYKGILGVHDLIVHTYGPDKTFITVHAEVASDVSILISHDVIDNIEKDFLVNEGINLVIHMDPIDVHDAFTIEMKEACSEMLIKIDPSLSLHDFRVVRGDTHNNFIFDVCAPIDFYMSDKELLERIKKDLPQGKIQNNAVVSIDRGYSTNVM